MLCGLLHELRLWLMNLRTVQTRDERLDGHHNKSETYWQWAFRRTANLAIIAVVQGLGTNLKNTFQSVSTALK